MIDHTPLVTSRLVLEPAGRPHAAGLARWMSSADLTRYLAWAPVCAVEDVEKLLVSLEQAQAEDRSYHWTICLNGEPCGLVSLIDVRRTHRLWRLDRAEIAYWIADTYQGRGLATEATAAVLPAAFGPLQLNRLIISHAGANAASGRVPTKLGFRYIGYEQQFFFKDGQWFDMHHYELLKDDWSHRLGNDRDA